MDILKVQLYFFFILFAAIFLLTFAIFLPYLSILAAAAAFSVVFYPVYRRVHAAVGYEGLASFLTVLIALCIILVPLGVFGMLAFEEAQDLYFKIAEQGGADAASLTKFIENRVHEFIPNANLDLQSYTRQILQSVVQNLGGVFTGLAQTFIAVFLGLIGFYYFLKDGHRLVKAVVNLSPLPDKYDDEIAHKLSTSVNSVLKGTLIIAIIQGILTGFGLGIFNVPNPALWGSLAAIAALIPGIGTALVLVPAIAYLFITGSSSSVLGLLIWGIVAVGLVDNFLGPKLMGRGGSIHSFIILLAVLGGLGFFGPIGFILGPLVVSLLFALGQIYTHYVKNAESLTSTNG